MKPAIRTEYTSFCFGPADTQRWHGIAGGSMPRGNNGCLEWRATCLGGCSIGTGEVGIKSRNVMNIVA